MKRGTALTCALMIVMMNTPAASAERNIVSTIRGADYAISVDADVYGEGTSGLQAYRVQTLEDRKSTRLNSSHEFVSRMPASA